jgi:methionyl-tRNA formyltransferase
MKDDFRVVFFTNKSSHGAELLRELKKNNVPIRAIFVESSNTKGNVKKVLRLLVQSGFKETFKAIFERVKTVLAFSSGDNWLSNDFYRSFSDEIHIVNDLNGKHCALLLKNLNPDIVILGGSRIIRENIIRIPQIGILNAHPGLLPKYRGVDVIRWAIYNRDDVGITIHFIDAGVDTGRILMRKVITLDANDTINSISRKAELLSAESMTEVVLKIQRYESLQIIDQLKESGKQHHLMPGNLRKKTEMILRKSIVK